MGTEEIRETVSALPHFRNLKGDRLERIVRCCRLLSFRSSELVFQQGHNRMHSARGVLAHYRRTGRVNVL